ncbi:putative transcription factor B3-Domain family [Helianthus anomalus]
MTCFYIHNLFLLKYIFNSCYGLYFLTLHKNYIHDVPLSFANKKWGDCWEKNKLQIYHECGKKWVVRVRTQNSAPIITDGWDRAVKDLNLLKDTLLVFRPLGDFALELSCFVNDICGESYFTFIRYAKLAFTVRQLILTSILLHIKRINTYSHKLNISCILLIIFNFTQIIEDCFIKQCYVNSLPSGIYQICYKGSYWNVEACKFHTIFVFAKGWPEVCNDLRILDDDLLIFRTFVNVVFELLVYRNETKILLSKKVESDDDSLLEISEADYFENVFKNIYEDDKVASLGEGKTVSQVLT